ncbi:phosphatidylinositol-glycan biosynthesis class W protein [Tetranychus urticae]|nr:phosphatidylinositol-glycan biosynthesis class W protein [Tetranychus urticae]XP_015785631.1 phosphatidylinositol-glycan biosynthesis class W protein [Tetranychus urticae]
MNASEFINFYQYTPPLELYHLSIVYTFSHFLVLSILTCYPILDTTKYFRRRIFIESTALAIPFLLSITLFQSITTTIPYLLLIFSLHLLFSHSKIFVVLKWPEIVFHSKPMPVKLPFITNLLANVVLTVSIVILAVDFQIFPYRLAKSKVYGWTLMDTGVAYFVALNAILSAESRQETQSSTLHYRSISISKIISPSLPLFILGGLRMLLVRLTDYHQEITEYGVSWNFFIVLGLTRVISSVLFHFFSSSCKTSIIIASCHQLFLSMGLGSFILSPDRSGFFRANKEGIFSLPGYISIYLFMIWIARALFEKRHRRSNFDNIIFVCDLTFIALMLGSVGLFSHYYIDPISRRECNLAFICATISLILFIIATELMVAVMIDILQYFGFMKKPPLVKSLLNEAVARNGLAVFLFANILTGLVNLTFQPKTRGSIVSITCLILYSYCICLFAIFCHSKRVNLKSFFSFSLRK